MPCYCTFHAGQPEDPLEGFLSSSDTSSEGIRNLDGDLQILAQADLGDARSKAAEDPVSISLIENHQSTKPDPFSSFSNWVQFEEEPWTTSSPEHIRTGWNVILYQWLLYKEVSTSLINITFLFVLLILQGTAEG